MSPTIHYLTVALLLVCSCCAIVKGADFGTLYSTQASITSYTFSSATPSCTLILSIERTSTQLLQFTLSKYQASAYTSRLPDNVYDILGVYGLSVRSYNNNNNGNSTQFTLTFTCPNGILNVKPTNMGIFTVPSYYFVNTGAASNTDASSISYTMSESNGFTSTIGFLGIVESGGSTLGSYQTFYGPYQFGYNLAHSYGQVSESLTFKLPNVVPSYSPYSFTLSKAPSYYKYQPSDYITLYSFEMSETSNPNTYGASLTYNYINGNSFSDVNDNSISIQKDTLQCICSTNGYSYITVSSTTSSNSLSCTYISSSCQYLSIVAKSAAVASSPNPSIDTAIEMEDGAYVFSGFITKKTYYKIDVPAGETLYLKHISLHLSSDYSGYITLNSESTYNSQKTYVYSSTQNSQLSYTNYLSTSKTVYVTIEPNSFLGTRIDFMPRLGSSFSFSNFPVVLVCAIIGPIFTLISVIVVITTIKKNSRRNQEEQPAQI